MAKYDKVSDDSEVTRWVRKKFLARDDQNKVVTDEAGKPKYVFPQAFGLRAKEEALSLTNVDYFTVDAGANRKAAAEAVRSSLQSKKIGDQDVFAFANCGIFLAACSRHEKKVRVVEDPVEGNPAHCIATQFPMEIDLLHEELASVIFADRLLYSKLD